MVPRELLDTAPLPGGGELRLYRRGAEYSIMLGGNELMNSRLSGSEEALATLALEALGARPRPALLIGGLGMGYTLRAALQRLGGGDAAITVAELVPAVVDWANGPMAGLFGDCLRDRRVTVAVADVADLIGSTAAAWDAILLDVDNGPDGLTRPGNDRLYSAEGLARARASLRPGGVLTLWSAAPAASFTQRLSRAGFDAKEVPVRARGHKGAHHFVWVARKRR